VDPRLHAAPKGHATITRLNIFSRSRKGAGSRRSDGLTYQAGKEGQGASRIAARTPLKLKQQTCRVVVCAACGSVFTRDGRLVASTAQEGLLRVLDR
jgi:hypothetical protein